MEDYKQRMIEEYQQTKARYQKLHKMLVKKDAGTLDFTPTCPIGLLREQAEIMGRYLYTLEVRAEIEGVDLDAKPYKPITNADRIRSMSDEELAYLLWKTGRNYRAVWAYPVADYNEHRDSLIAWLRQTAGGESHDE